MTKFKFKLESALRLRQLRVGSETAKLQELIAQRSRWEKSRTALLSERAEAAAFVQTAEQSGSGDLRALASFTIGLELHAGTIRDAIARTDALIAEQNKRVQQSEADALCLSKLRQKRQAEWNLQLDAEVENMAQELWLCAHTKALDRSE